jgi:hypothetical protein
MRLGHRLAAAGAAALLLLSVAASAAFGYAGQVANQVTVAGPAGVLACNTALVVTATVLDSGGNPVDGRDVVWTFGAGMQTGDHIVLPTTTTNLSGVTSTTVILACVVGNRTIVATAAPASGQVVLGITVTGLPPTSTDPGSTPMWTYVLALLGICLASFMIGRRVLQGR